MKKDKLPPIRRSESLKDRPPIKLLSLTYLLYRKLVMSVSRTTKRIISLLNVKQLEAIPNGRSEGLVNGDDHNSTMIALTLTIVASAMLLILDPVHVVRDLQIFKWLIDIFAKLREIIQKS
jgi:hypothetical protein